MKIVNCCTVLVLCGLALSACQSRLTSTPYQPLKHGEGYVSRQLSNNTHEIQVRGNVVTTIETLKMHFHRRASELCRSSNYKSDMKDHETTDIRLVQGYNYAYRSLEKMPYVSGTVRCRLPKVVVRI